MTKHARFTLEVTDKDRSEFANLSGDFNPLHIDDDYVSTGFKKCILHGAFSVGVNFDILDGGMNAAASKAAKIATRDRSPIGNLSAMDGAALDLKWLLDNAGSLISGAVIDLSGGNIP